MKLLNRLFGRSDRAKDATAAITPDGDVVIYIHRTEMSPDRLLLSPDDAERMGKALQRLASQARCLEVCR